MAGLPAAGYGFNTFQEIKSHSSILYNERMAILFYLLDMKSMRLNTSYGVPDILEVRGILKQIYKNVRTLIRNNPTVRATLNLETKEEGCYITDVAMSGIDKMVEFCETNGYSTKRVYIITDELNKYEMLMKDILQYFHYFIRPDFRQKPDIDVATEKYKEIADKKTIEELRELAGRSHKIDFDNLGSSRVALQEETEIEDNLDDVEEIEEEDENGHINE
ncbi:hypothetical protein CMI37_05865 [Candidatus Pacearchaeota archaeon]|jgi:hypothetical protein|nr:hypothetical protein [Candidatus Pacearchaeota archaeon]|tara:strand:+ start:2278 stop:2937 length:660 start_codon:yes stop_codon:yes gene_type:complete